MKLHTRHSRAAEAADMWEKQCNTSSYHDEKNQHESIVTQLRALGSTPDPSAVDAIIGNDWWTICHCDECDQDREAVIDLGDNPDYGSGLACLCPQCLAAALGKFEVTPSDGGIPASTIKRFSNG